MGEAYTLAKFYKKAEWAFKRALRLKPDYGEVYYDLGMLYINWGRYKAAQWWLKKAAELDTYGERYKAFFALAHLYKKLGNEKAYLESLKRAVDLYPKYKEALEELANYYYQKGNFAKAEYYLRLYLINYPNDERISLKLAKLLIEENKLKEAKLLLKQLIDSSTNPQTVQKAYKLVNQLLLKEAELKLKRLKR